MLQYATEAIYLAPIATVDKTSIGTVHSHVLLHSKHLFVLLCMR